MLTLIEWSKLNPQPLQSGVVEIFARENPVLERLGFQSIAGNAYKYNVETTLPGVAFRDFNEAYAESTGVINPATETLKIIGGDSDYDVALIAMGVGGNDNRAIHDGLKVKAMTLSWLATFFDGDSGINSKEFDGLNVRLTGNQVIEAGTNGAVLDQDMLDVLVDSVSGSPSILLMSKSMRREVVKLGRASNVVRVGADAFGREVTTYAGVPIGIVEDDAAGSAILGFDETVGSSDVTSSIYAVRFGDDMLHGIQTQAMSVRDLGELDSKPSFRTRVEWYSGLVLKHPKCAARLTGLLAS